MSVLIGHFGFKKKKKVTQQINRCTVNAKYRHTESLVGRKPDRHAGTKCMVLRWATEVLTFDLSDEVTGGTENVVGVKRRMFGDDCPQDAQQFSQSLLNHAAHTGWLLCQCGGGGQAQGRTKSGTKSVVQ